MHPILSDRRRLVAHILAWQLPGVLLTVGLRGDAGWIPAAAFFLPISHAYGFMCLSAWYICRAFPLDPRLPASAGAKRLVAHGCAAIIAAALWVAVAGLWLAIIDEGTWAAGVSLIYRQQQWTLFVLGVLLYWLTAGGFYLFIAFQASRAADVREMELSLLAREAELKALRAQIDPHFIFNSLHSVSALTTVDPAAAREMCLLLADFLRETLRLGAHDQITVADELALVDRFLAIEQVRLGTRLRITRDTAPGSAACLVPPLLLQPLVENAVVHGVSQLVEGGTVRVDVRREAAVLAIVVENPCDPDRLRSTGSGLGLDLLRKRVASQCGAAGLVRAHEEAGRFRVELRIPAVTAA